MKKNSICSKLTGAMLAVLVMGFVLAGCGSSPVAAAAPDSAGITSYYVRADGNDANTGTSEAAPFKTLVKAVEAAAKTPVKKITVIGTLAGNTIIKETDKTVGEITKYIKKIGDKIGYAGIDWSVDESDPDEILITGKPDASGAERAVLTPVSHDSGILNISTSTIRLEHIEISGLKTTKAITAVMIVNGTLTLARGASVTKNEGGGLFANRSVVVMRDNAEVSDNEGPYMVGINPGKGSVLIMRDTSRVTGNKVTSGNGGGVGLVGASLLMQDNAEISGNTAEKGGGAGVFAVVDAKNGFTSRITMSGKSLVSWNTAAAQAGGGVVLIGSTLLMQDYAAVTGNSAGKNGGGVLVLNDGDNIGQISMSGSAAVSGNTTDMAGGGISVEGAAVTMRDNAAVSGNKAALDGGGILVLNDGDSIGRVIMIGSATVRDNTTAEYGGGIFLGGELYLKDDVKVTGNTAAVGGGVYANGNSTKPLYWDKDKFIANYITGNTAPTLTDTNVMSK
jgi:hypothetical protein